MQLTKVVAASRKVPSCYTNMPKRYVDRQIAFVEKRAPNLPQYMQKVFRYKKNAYYDQWRPWEVDFQRLNQQGVPLPTIFVEPIREWTFFRGDRVEVLRGKDKGKQGIINYIVKERNWVFVQGLNLEYQLKNREKNFVGRLECIEQPYLINHEVKLVDPSDLKPTDVEWRYDDDNNKVRVSVRTERILPMPQQAFETKDYVEKAKYKDQPKDTPADQVSKITFTPISKTFEMDICDGMDIKDDRVPYPMYWY